MSPYHRKYEPIESNELAPQPSLPPVAGMAIQKPGVYFHAGDVSAILGRMAEQFHGEGRQALLEAGSAFAESADTYASEAGLVFEDEPEPVEAIPCSDSHDLLPCQLPQGHDGPHYHAQVIEGATTETTWESIVPIVPIAPPPAAESDPHPGQENIDRVELFPNEDGNYWYARAIDSGGFIIEAETTVQGVSQPQVEAGAAAKWPGKPVHQLTDGMGDSLWDEEFRTDAQTFGYNQRRRPSPRRLFANTPN